MFTYVQCVVTWPSRLSTLFCEIMIVMVDVIIRHSSDGQWRNDHILVGNRRRIINRLVGN